VFGDRLEAGEWIGGKEFAADTPVAPGDEKRAVLVACAGAAFFGLKVLQETVYLGDGEVSEIFDWLVVLARPVQQALDAALDGSDVLGVALAFAQCGDVLIECGL